MKDGAARREPVVVVTGAAGAIGSALARRLRDRGRTVIGVDQRDADIVVDLANRAARASLIDELSGARIEGLALVAGLSGFGSAPADVASVNYFASVELAEHLLPALVAAAPSAVVGVGSIAAGTGSPIARELAAACEIGDEAAARALAKQAGAAVAYSASKAALATWIQRRSISDAWIGSGVNLNAVVAGVTDTPMTRGMVDDPLGSAVLTRTDVPAGRWARPSEVAAALEFLVGTDARFVVGTSLVVDGGTTAAQVTRRRERPEGGGESASH